MAAIVYPDIKWLPINIEVAAILYPDIKWLPIDMEYYSGCHLLCAYKYGILQQSPSCMGVLN